MKVPCSAKDDTIAMDVAISEVLVTDSVLEDETGTSNASSEKSDIDSVELPLCRSQKENNNTIGFDDASFVKEHIENSELERETKKRSITRTGYNSVVSTSGIAESVVPDSFDSDESRYSSINQHGLFPDTEKDHQSSFQLKNYGDQTLDLSVCVDAEAESPVQAIAVKDHEINLHSELRMFVNNDPREGEVPYLNLQYVS
ncbi:Hypothetical predicted protein [Olea europaea subsp. europaea]|uniref:Uncharacterized protein n=1 Tax=Olea europaea subsp. europaea TaxID=158383 RepID=A0A8S0R8Z7_OLEEU|nr:Hypothetical predicted protein [Olea europaea subsp. europaea]